MEHAVEIGHTGRDLGKRSKRAHLRIPVRSRADAIFHIIRASLHICGLEQAEDEFVKRTKDQRDRAGRM